MFFKKDKSIEMSAPQIKMLHGVEIKKLPVGRYIKLLQHAETFVPEVLTALFPEMKDGAIAMKFTEITVDELKAFLARAAAVIPEQLCMIAGSLLGIPEGRLLDPDEGITPVQLIEVLIATWEANDLSDFFPLVRQLQGLTAQSSKVNTGSSDGYQPPQD